MQFRHSDSGRQEFFDYFDNIKTKKFVKRIDQFRSVPVRRRGDHVPEIDMRDGEGEFWVNQSTDPENCKTKKSPEQILETFAKNEALTAHWQTRLLLYDSSLTINDADLEKFYEEGYKMCQEMNWPDALSYDAERAIYHKYVVMDLPDDLQNYPKSSRFDQWPHLSVLGTLAIHGLQA